MSENIESHVNNLRGIIGNLPVKSQSFATSLCTNFDRKGTLSPKQLYWVEKLYNENKGGSPKQVRMKNEPAELKILREHKDLLPKKNQKFAQDLINQWDARGFVSRKQQFWLETLAEKAAERAASQPVEVGLEGYGAVTELIARSGDSGEKELKEPSVTLWVDAPDGHTHELRIRQPGTRKKDQLFRAKEELVVEEVQRTVRAIRSQTFHGLINKIDNSYYHAKNTPHWIVEALENFKIDPITSLTEMGKLAGRCSFCQRALDDERSTAMGYGPVCAKRFSLPWSLKTARPIIQKVHAVVNLKALEIRPGLWAVIDLDTNTIVQTFDTMSDASAACDEWSKVEHQPETN